MKETLEKAKRVKLENESEWIAIPEVVSVGVGYVQENEIGIIIGVKNGKIAVAEQIPNEIDGISIEVKTVNQLRAL